MKPSRIKNKIILIQPVVGISGEFACHIPLSLLYVASGLIKEGFEVILMDNRLLAHSWKEELIKQLDNDVFFVGITVMSGSPIANAIEVSKSVKAIGNIPVVWGGAHSTIMPRQVLEKDFVDFTVSGHGVNAARKLALLLRDNSQCLDDFNKIPGLGHKKDGKVYLNPPHNGFEHVHYKDIPYNLIKDFSHYRQIGSSERIFPVFSSYGCVYNCSFCISPHMYRNFEEKWVRLPTQEVVDHMSYLKDNYGATEIYFYDDDSFIKLEHVRSIIHEVKRRNFKIKMSFRGMRVNEVLKMDKEYLGELAEAGTHILHIGIESGSQRILNLFNKGIKVGDIIKINKIFSENKKILAGYNWIIGTPTETLQDLYMTRDLILKLIDDNPHCLIFHPNKFRPVPGTELFDFAIQHGYQLPDKLESWVDEELESDKCQPWYTPYMEKTIKMFQITSYFIDNKASLLLKKQSIENWLLKLLCRLYKPIAKWRFSHGITSLLFEYSVYQFYVRKYRSNGGDNCVAH